MKHRLSRHVLAALLVLVAVFRVAGQGQDHPGQYDRADVEAGSRLYAAQCAGCHGPTGDQVAGVSLRRGEFKTVTSDDDLVRFLGIGRPDAGMPSFATFQPRDLTAIVAFIRAGFDANSVAVRIGDAGRGSVLFSGKGGCTTCHRVTGTGARIASDLSDIGAVRSAPALHRVLTAPADNVIPANRRVRAVMKDGRTVNGRRLNEDTLTIQLIDETDRLRSIDKADLQSLDLVPGTTMPAATLRLSDAELADVIAYLLSLKGLP